MSDSKSCVICYSDDVHLLKMTCCSSCTICHKCMSEYSTIQLQTGRTLNCPLCRKILTILKKIIFVSYCHRCKLCDWICDYTSRMCTNRVCYRHLHLGSPFSENTRSIYNNTYIGRKIVYAEIKNQEKQGNDTKIVLTKPAGISYMYGISQADTYVLKTDGTVDYFDYWTHERTEWTKCVPLWFPHIQSVASYAHLLNHDDKEA